MLRTLVPHTNRPKPTLNLQGHAGRDARLWLHLVVTGTNPGKPWTQTCPLMDGWQLWDSRLYSQRPQYPALHTTGQASALVPAPKPAGGQQPQDHPGPVASLAGFSYPTTRLTPASRQLGKPPWDLATLTVRMIPALGHTGPKGNN